MGEKMINDSNPNNLVKFEYVNTPLVRIETIVLHLKGVAAFRIPPILRRGEPTRGLDFYQKPDITRAVAVIRVDIQNGHHLCSFMHLDDYKKSVERWLRLHDHLCDRLKEQLEGVDSWKYCPLRRKRT